MRERRVRDGGGAGLGEEAPQAATDALGRLSGRASAGLVIGDVAGVALGAVEPWRIGVRRGPAGVVALVLGGSPRDRAGTPARDLAGTLADAVGARWTRGGFEGLTDALERSAADLRGRYIVVAAGGEALRVAVVASSRTPLVVHGDHGALIASARSGLPPGAVFERLGAGGLRVVAVDRSHPVPVDTTRVMPVRAPGFAWPDPA